MSNQGSGQSQRRKSGHAFSISVALKPFCGVLKYNSKPTSDGLHPSSDGLQPTSTSRTQNNIAMTALHHGLLMTPCYKEGLFRSSSLSLSLSFLPAVLFSSSLTSFRASPCHNASASTSESGGTTSGPRTSQHHLRGSWPYYWKQGRY